MPKIEEFVFHHPASRTLIVNDSVFNPGTDVSLTSKLFLRLAGTEDRFAASRLFRAFIKGPNWLDASLG